MVAADELIAMIKSIAFIVVLPINAIDCNWTVETTGVARWLLLSSSTKSALH